MNMDGLRRQRAFVQIDLNLKGLLMLRYLPLGFVATLLGPLGGCGSLLEADGPPLDTVASVEVDRYAGKWYQIARYPNWFQSGCASSTAEYTVNADGTVRVFNTCLDADGGVKSTIQGTARVVDRTTNAKLEVRFPVVPFPADYWIIQLGENYEYAVVGEPGRTNLFILSRTPALDQDTLDAILGQLADQGYDTARLIYDTPVANP
jgi:apolipoprotein D and lipocalin family protein